MNADAAPGLLLLAFASLANATAADSILEQVPRLQKFADLANTGALGCGAGQITIVTSRGEVTAEVSLDPIHVFGDKVAADDLLTLLKARVEFNRSGKGGPMSGDVALLCNLCAQLLGESDEPAAVPVLVALLEDKEATISTHATLALLQLGDQNEELRPTIRGINFPRYALLRVESRSNKLPTWLNERD